MNKSFAQWCRLALLSLLLVPAIAFAQQPADRPIVTLGNAVVTGFSGTLAPDAAKVRAKKPAVDLTFINPDGPSARIIDVSRPGYVWDGRVFAAPKTFNVLAKDVGQVFGVALDDAPQPNIYLAATSVFGLNIVARGRNGQPERRKKGGPGVGWMKGQFGLDLQGGPGAIYKIDGRTGVPTLFANVTLDGVPNPGAGLGNLAFDAAHRQLFVSDLYTGMIHRFDLDGKELDRYNHGVTGLGLAKLPPVAFNPANRPNIASARFDSEKPDTWGFAPAARRVWGLAVHEGRLYYSVVSGPQIWSVGLTREGAFAGDARWELDVPAQAGPLPISDIAFSNKGAMLLAQRALTAGAYDYSAFTRPGEPQVFRIWLKGPNDPPSPGRWKLTPEEYAVGFAGNYRNTNGGIALGYGYGQDGMASGNACEFSLWTTAQNMRNAPPLKNRLDPGGALVVHGIQGLPASPVRDINTPPWLSYSVAYGDKADNPRAAGHLGSVRIYTKPCASPALYSGPGYPASPPYIVVTVRPPAECIVGVNCPLAPACPPNCPPSDNPIDIGIAKIGEVNVNNPDGPYNFTIGIRNMAGPIATSTTLTVTDVVPAGMTFTSITGTNWSCLPLAPVAGGTTLTCTYTGTFPIAANQILGSIAIVADGGNGPYENCAILGQTDSEPSNDKACVTVRKDYGNLTVAKEVENKTDPQISTVGLVYPVAVTCGSNVTNLNLVDGLPQTVGPIAYGTLCKVVEGTPPLPTGACPAGHLAWTTPPAYLPSDSVTIVSGINPTIRVHNTLECVPDGGGDGYVLLKKEVISGLQGYAAPPLNYPVYVTCTNGTSGTFNLSSDGTAQAVGNLPIGTSCTVNEPSVTNNACPSGMTTVWGPVAYHPSNTASAAMPGPTVTVTNTFTCSPAGDNPNGGIEVKKVVTNHTDPHVSISSSISFAISTSCQLGSSPAVVTPMPMLDGGSQTITGLAYNTTCDVTEAPPPLPDLGPLGCITPGYVPVWTTVLPPQTTINAAMTTVTVQNFLDCVPAGGGQLGSLVVTKTLINKTEGQLVTAGLSYPISVSCASGGSPAVVTNFNLAENGSHTVSNIALNSSCTVSETTPMPTPTGTCATVGAVPTWTMPPTITPAPPVPVNGTNVSVTVQNTLECKGGGGYLLVQKEITNNAGVTIATLNSLTFPAVVTCNGNDTPLTLTRNTSQVVHNIPFTQVCTVVETLPPAPAGSCAIAGEVPTWVTPPVYTPANATIEPGPGKTIVVRNTLNCEPGGTNSQLGTVNVTKTVVNNAGATNLPTTFPVQITCTPPSGPDVVTNVSLANGGSMTINNIAPGSSCIVHEPTPADVMACVATASWTVSYTGQNPAVIGSTPATIGVTNTLNCSGGGGGSGGGGSPQSGSVTVKKTIKSGTTSGPLAAVPFPITLTCNGNVTSMSLLIGNSQTVSGIPAGAVCTVSETLPTPPAICASGTVPTWATPIYNPASVTVTAGGNLPMTVSNNFSCVPSNTEVKRLKCPATLVPNSEGTSCTCRAGTHLRGKRCVEQIVCHKPATLNKRGTGCDCPRGMTKKGNSCVEREREPKPERKRPNINADDVIRVLPGLLGPGGFGGGGRPRDGGGAGGSGGGYKPPGVK